jgi:hypothetical protein
MGVQGGRGAGERSGLVCLRLVWFGLGCQAAGAAGGVGADPAVVQQKLEVRAHTPKHAHAHAHTCVSVRERERERERGRRETETHTQREKERAWRYVLVSARVCRD